MSTLKPRLKNPYPAIDFQRAYNYLKGLCEKFPRKQSFTRNELLEQGLGFPANNGIGHNVVGALSHYDILRREGSRATIQYGITSEALQLLAAEQDVEQWKTLAYKAVTSPVLYNFLSSKYPDNHLPVGLDGLLIRKYEEVTQKNVSKILHRYKVSLKFVESFKPEASEVPKSVPPTGEDLKQKYEFVEFPFPLSDGTLVTLKLPPVMIKGDVERINSFLNSLVITGEKDGRQ